MSSLETPKKWFKANVDSILKLYGEAHRIQKEDLFLGELKFTLISGLVTYSFPQVVGALDASDYALFVSHNHPEGQVCYSAFRHLILLICKLYRLTSMSILIQE